MASQHQLADPCLRPLKRLRTSSEGPKVDPECHGSYQESPIDDSNAFDCLDAPGTSHSESWFLPSSELGQRSSLDDPGDSGFSDGATPPASCDDSQDSFPVSNLPTTSGYLNPSSALNFAESKQDSHSLPGCSKDVAHNGSNGLLTLNEKVDLNLSSDMLHDGNSRDDGPESNSDNSDSDDNDEDEDRISTISGLSDLSGSDWKPTAGPFTWVQRQMLSGADPRTLLQDLIAGDAEIPDHLDQLTLWKIILNMVCEPPRRKKLPDINTLQNVVDLIRNSKNILVLTGAGVSVSCGIPDFRSRDGVYARLAEDFPDLPDPQAMFDIHYFRKNPRPFFKFAREIYPGQFEPSPCHRFIKCLEKHGSLLRNYTQNIDTLEQVVGLKRVVQCHGSFATATCMKCKYKVEADAIKEDIFEQRIPYCPLCRKNCPNDADETSSMSNEAYFRAHNASAATGNTLDSVASELDPAHPNIIGPGCSKSNKIVEDLSVPPILKPDIVFFGESLGDEFHNSVAKDKNEVDLLIMIGSSLKVRPVALIPSSVDLKVPQILINREPLSHLTPDVQLLGDCDGIINEICLRLGAGWEEGVHRPPLSEVQELNPPSERLASEPDQETENAIQNKMRRSVAQRLPEGKFYFCPPNRYVFPGAEVFDDSDDDNDNDNTNSTRSNFGDSSTSDEDDEEEEDEPSSSQQSNSAEEKSKAKALQSSSDEGGENSLP